MTESIKASNSSAKSAPSNPAQPAAKPAAKPTDKPAAKASGSHRTRHWSALLLALVVLAGLVGAGYYYGLPIWQQQLGQQRALLRQVEALEQSLAQQSTASSELSAAVAANQQQLDQLPGRLSAELSAQLNGPIASLTAAQQHNQRRLNELDGNVGRQWQLAELQYIVHVAAQRLVVERDVEPSIALLQRADALLAGWNEPALAPLRAGLAADIGALQALPVVDRQGLHNRLQAVAEQAQLVLRPTVAELSFTPPPAPAPVAADWRARVVQLGELVGQLFILKRSNQPLPEVVAEQRPALIALRFSQAIEQASLALWRADQLLYRQSLALCEQLLELAAVDSPSLSAALAALAAESVAPPALPASRAAQALYEWQRSGSGVEAQP